MIITSGEVKILQTDTLLLPFLHEMDEAGAERQLAELISKHADPIIKEIIRFKLRVSLKPGSHDRFSQDAEDTYAEALVQVIEELREFKARQNRSINNFRSYVATITYHSCYEYLRRKYPRRSHLKDRLRYLFNHHQSFAIWENNQGGMLCGFAVWKNEKKAAIQASRLQQLFGGRQSFLQVKPGGENVDLAALMAEIFDKTGGPVELEYLVNLATDLLGIKDEADLKETGEDEEKFGETLADPRPGVDTEMDRRIYLQQLWQEICELPIRQRAALLLNLKDEQGRGIIVLFNLLGIASMEKIATALDIVFDQFVDLWNKLPIDDEAIAGRLGITRQQVINLRKSARERLARRMKQYS
jgi:RNA polymerase sigma factor (sigma-70 family)